MPKAQPVAPLTIIAIFAGIIEASALATLPFLSESSQKLYTWFLVGFPFFLTALFFLTLNFNYKSFYSPLPNHSAYDDAEIPTTSASPESASEARLAKHDEPITFMFSGPDAYRMMEHHLQFALSQPPLPPRTWRLCNVDKGLCAQLTISALEDDIGKHGG
ncbi:hypothetical protein ACIP1G_24230 [Pseudomonas sp. NPDC089392]|uniref:hypothetical protein n=1 Tax=Pseudomonas sp. NPDC089392 TaxID=3364459 RepID=UPI00381F3495